MWLRQSLRPAFVVLLLWACATIPASAGPVLWIGNNGDPSLPVIALNLDGTLESLKYGFDSGLGLAASDDTLYVNDGLGTVSTYPLPELTPVSQLNIGGPGVDMALVGTTLYVANPFDMTIDAYSADDGSYQSSLALAFAPYGLAFDGVNFWVSEDVTGALYSVSPDGLTITPAAFIGTPAYGLGWGEGQLWVGGQGVVDAWDTTNEIMVNSLNVPDGRFVNTVEFGPAAVPEPFSALLAAAGIAVLGLIRRSGRFRR